MKINDPFLDGFTGSFRKRNIIIYKIYGKTVGRSFPSNYNLKKTEIREKQTNHLTEPNNIVKLLFPFTNFLYPHKENCSLRSSFHSHIMNDVMTYEDNQWIINLDKITLSNGNLRLLPELTISQLPNHQLKISWLNTAGKALARNDDNIIIVVYSPTVKRTKIITPSDEPIFRNQSSCTFSIPNNWQNLILYIYVYSISQTKKRISNTQFLTTTVP